MTFIYELDLESLKMYLRTKNKLSGSRLSNIRVLQTHTHIHTRTDATEHITTPFRGWQ